MNESIQKGGGDWRPFADQGLITRADAAVLDAAAAEQLAVGDASPGRRPGAAATIAFRLDCRYSGQ